MSDYQFKTNINCGGCIAAVTPHLNGNQQITEWKVDTANPEKLLTVSSELSADEVKAIVNKAGYKADLVQ